MSELIREILRFPEGVIHSLRTSGADQLYAVGQKGRDRFGNSFKYCKAGAAAIFKGQMMQAQVPVADHTNIALGGAAVVGSDEIQFVTALGTALTADQYKGGIIHVNDAVGEGNWYIIKSHDATTTPLVKLEERIVEALDATSELTFTANPANGIVVTPANPTAMPVGVAMSDIAANEFGWVQTWGLVAFLVDTGDTIVAGDIVGTAGTAADAGAVGVAAATSNWGWAAVANAATEYASIMLTIEY